MNLKETPLYIDGIDDNIYPGFWARFGSFLLDIVFVTPVGFLTIYLNSLDKYVYFLTVIPSLIFGVWYNIYLPKRYGGTPGKLVMGMKIIGLNGELIGWEKATLRHIILFTLTLLSIILTCFCILKADNETFKSLGWVKQSQYLMTFAPLYFKLYTWSTNIWMYSEFIVLLTNKRKRAIHDFIAGTVIVKSKYLPDVLRVMKESSSSDSIKPMEGILD